MTKRFGFTLAEVLITLGIIGVVAAMSIPALIANTNSSKFRSQFKKSLSSLNQAALMAQAQYDFDYSSASACGTTTNGNPKAGSSTMCALLNGTLAGAKVTTFDKLRNNNGGTYAITAADSTANYTTANSDIVYTMADGSIFIFKNTAANCTLDPGAAVSGANCKGIIDVNGPALPNKEVKCDAGGSNGSATAPCVVKKQTGMTDVFPVAIHDSVVEPLSDAARYILSAAK